MEYPKVHRVIGGVTYNTKTSLLLAQQEIRAGAALRATYQVYLTRAGTYFLAECVFSSIYRPRKREWNIEGNLQATPLEKEAAIQWVETNKPETVQQVFEWDRIEESFCAARAKVGLSPRLKKESAKIASNKSCTARDRANVRTHEELADSTACRGRSGVRKDGLRIQCEHMPAALVA